MSESMSYTLYQQGTYLHHALIEGGFKRTFQLIFHYAIPIVEDESEAWLDTYPLEMRISKELAQEAVRQTRMMDEKNTRTLRQKKLLSERTSFLQEVEHLAAALARHQRNFVDNIESVLGRRPTTDDLDELSDLGKPIQAASQRQPLLDAIALFKASSQPATSSQISDETFAQWKAELPQGPIQPTAEEKDAREREEYRGYRNLIENVERSRQKGPK